MRFVVLLAALFVSLASTAVGYRQSYRDQDLGRGRFLITTSANEYNQNGDAHQFAFQRAKEICPDGFDVLSQDGQAVAHDYHGDNGLLALAGSSEKHEVSLVVQCLGPDRPEVDGATLAAKLAPKASEAPPAAPTEASPAAPAASVTPVVPTTP
jgi:hypothetical protein